jgi:hypothetical protein
MSIFVFVLTLHITCKLNYLPVREHWGMILKTKILAMKGIHREGVLFTPINL